jgi:tRNA-modifying protein YgfZ
MSTGWLAPESPDLVWFTGPDAVRFLNDLVSQEIGAMAPGEVRRSLLLGVRGKLDHILWVLRGEGLVGLVTDGGRGEELAGTLGRYRIRVEVDIEPETRPLWVVFGDATTGSWSGDRQGPLGADVSWRTISRRLVAGDRPEMSTGSLADYHLARIASGEPAWGVDVDDKTIPQETGLVDATVDFTKGCYLGQELVARIHSRGHVNRHLRLIELSEPVPVGTVMTAGDREIGILTSVADNLGLALIRKEVAPGDEVDAAGTKALVRDLPNPRP